LQQVSSPLTDLIDEWLQAAPALSIEILGERPLPPSAIAKGSAVQTDRSGGHEESRVAVHVLRIDAWMTIIGLSTRAWATHGGCGGLDSP